MSSNEKEQTVEELPTTNNKLDIAQQLLEKITKEKQDVDTQRANLKRANEFIGKIFGALQKTMTRRIVHPNTKKVIGYKFKYYGDGDGKTIYDYVTYNKDPFEKKILESLAIRYAEDDNQDCNWISKRIQIDWLNTKYSV